MVYKGYHSDTITKSQRKIYKMTVFIISETRGNKKKSGSRFEISTTKLAKNN